MEMMQKTDRNRTSVPVKVMLFIIGSIVITRIIFYLLYVMRFGDFSIMGFLLKIDNWDAVWYKSIVTDGYPSFATGQASWAFFPLYPLTVRALIFVTGINIDLAGFVVSNLCYFVSCIYAYRYIMKTRKSQEEAVFYLALMTFGVCGFYETIMYTEAMYLMFLCMSFYYLEQDEYLKMGICGILMSATRNTGVFFVFAVLFHWISVYRQKNAEDRNPVSFIRTTLDNSSLVLGTMMVPAGLFAYMYYLWKRVGDPLAFVHIQKAFMLDTKPGIVDVTIRAFRLYGGQLWFYGYLTGLLLVLIMICTNRKNSERVWGIINWFVPLQRGLGCMHRYLHIALVVELTFSDYCMKIKRRYRILILCLMFVAETVLMIMWLDGNGWLV